MLIMTLACAAHAPAAANAAAAWGRGFGAGCGLREAAGGLQLTVGASVCRSCFLHCRCRSRHAHFVRSQDPSAHGGQRGRH